MRITRIKARSFLGLDNLDIAIDRPVLLIAGPNASGKTSIAHALRFVLDNDLCRVEHKKDIKDLIREGAKIGSVTVSLMNSGSDTGTVFEYTRSAATGNFTTPHPPPEPHPALRFCLDPAAFTSMSAQERRGFLYHLMGVKITAADIITTLETRQHPPALIQHIAINLHSGFPSAHTEAQSLARDGKVRWREVAGGETYGEIKAATWSCEAPAVDDDAITHVKTEIACLDEDIATLQARQGALTERTANRKRLMDRMGNAQRIAGELETREAAVAEARIRIEQLTAEQRDLRERLGRAKGGLTVEGHASQGTFFKCPACGASLNYSRGECKVGEPAAVDVTAEIAIVEEQVKHFQIAVSNVDNRKLIADRLMVDRLNAVGVSRAAAESLRDFQEEDESEEGNGDADIKEAIEERVGARLSARQVLNDLEAALRAHDEATDKTQRAKIIHEEIKAATALAADLAPDGLPAELLAQAMRPINERLRDSAVMAGWPSASITTDDILVHSRDWDLASESERWRARAMIAEAIAHLSGIKCFVLDGFDILEPALRAQALAWLLAVAPEHETIITLATLKQPPANLPGGIQSVWLG